MLICCAPTTSTKDTAAAATATIHPDRPLGGGGGATEGAGGTGRIRGGCATTGAVGSTGCVRPGTGVSFGAVGRVWGSSPRVGIRGREGPSPRRGTSMMPGREGPSSRGEVSMMPALPPAATLDGAGAGGRGAGATSGGSAAAASGGGLGGPTFTDAWSGTDGPELGSSAASSSPFNKAGGGTLAPRRTWAVPWGSSSPVATRPARARTSG